MDGRDHHLAAASAAAGLLRFPPADWQGRSRFRATPIPARIMAAADDRRRFDLRQCRGARPGRRKPSGRARARGNSHARSPCCRASRRSPRARRACARQPQIGGGLVGGQKIGHRHHMHLDAVLLKLTIIVPHAQDVCETEICRCRPTSPPCNWCSPAIRRCSRSCGCRWSSACPRWCWPRWSACRSAPCSRSPDFPAAQGVIVVLNALMGLPPVVVGLAVYLLLSRSGPLGSLGLLFTPTRHGHRADHPGRADHRRADAPDHRGSLARISRRTDRDECRPGRPRRDADLGRALQPASPRCWRASAARPPRSAPSSSSAAISTASPAP